MTARDVEVVHYSKLYDLSIIALVIIALWCCGDAEYATLGFYEFLEELNETLEEEEQHERDTFAKQQLEC